MAVAYPAHRAADVVLRDGSTLHVRPVRPDDERGLRAFFEGLSPRSRWFRFFSAGVRTPALARQALDVDYHDRFGLVATRGAEGEIVANAAYSRTGPERAEVAFAIADDLQGKGLGTILLAHLAAAAKDAGVTVLEAEVLPENHRMIEVFRESGFPVDVTSRAGVIHVELPASLSPEAAARFEARDQIAAVAAVRSFLEPSSVAVIGASRRRGTVGGELFHNLLTAGFPGPVYPVNAAADVVQSVRAYRSVGDVPGPVELAVIAVPAAAVIDAARQCASKGVRAVLVISAGFAEAGPDGVARQQELLRVCREAGMRLVGPNCLGVLNTAPARPLNATFAPSWPGAGPVAFLSQSGALGLAIIDYSTSLDLGLSSFASVGNKADISGNDLIRYWEQDPATSVILLYLESFGNPRKFARIASRVAKRKPIVAVKSGRSQAGARATSSHTGALIAASDVTVDALFHQSGVIRTDNLEELFDVAALLSHAPVPAGRRVAILTNAGGPGIMCADACEADGLEVPELSVETRARLSTLLPSHASLGNPVDMTATATAEDYAGSLRVLLGSGDADAVIVIFIPPLLIQTERVADAIRQAVAESQTDIPILQVLMSSGQVKATQEGERPTVPTFRFPESAARALARAARYAAWRSREEGARRQFEDIDADKAAAIVSRVLADGPGWLPPADVYALLGCYGLPVARWSVTTTPEEAGEAAERLGGTVALKAIAPGLLHKSEASAVRLDLRGAAAVSGAATEIAEHLGKAGLVTEGFVVQEMVEDGVEMLVGVVQDPLFGPVVACGAGGVTAELIRDVAVRLSPLTDHDAREMITSLATFPLLDGFRGAPRADVAALEEVLLRVSALVDGHPEVVEMDLNPVIVTPAGAAIVDARLRVEPARPPAPWPSTARPAAG